MTTFNKMFLTLALATTSLVSATVFAADRAPVRNVVNISAVSIPSGFENSEPVAVISGLFPNSCYSWDKSEVTNVDALTHEVRSFATIRQGMCLMVMIPFSEEVNIGKLQAGEHTLRFINNDGTYMEKKLTVE